MFSKKILCLICFGKSKYVCGRQTTKNFYARTSVKKSVQSTLLKKKTLRIFVLKILEPFRVVAAVRLQ